LHEILLATDFCEPARRALAFAKQIAGRRGAPLRAVHVLDLTGTDRNRQASFAAGHASAERALREIRLELRLAGIQNAATLISAGEPAAALRELVNQHRPSLLILGLNGASSQASAALGSTTRSLLADLPCPILTVNECCPGHPRKGAPDRVVYVVDTVPESLQAALAAWPLSPRRPSPAIIAIQSPRAQPAWELPAALKRRLHPILIPGDAQATETILHQATKTGLIVLALQRGPRHASLARGSLAHTLLIQAPCPVLTVPA
jgi:nucleotide-binding universal stress UspA family protein